MPSSTTHWKPVIFSAALLLVFVIWYVWPTRLSPLEKSLVGSWRLTYAAPRGTFVLELRNDRSCLSRRE